MSHPLTCFDMDSLLSYLHCIGEHTVVPGTTYSDLTLRQDDCSSNCKPWCSLLAIDEHNGKIVWVPTQCYSITLLYHMTGSVEGMFWMCQSVPNWLFLVKTYKRSLLFCFVLWRWMGQEKSAW